MALERCLTASSKMEEGARITVCPSKPLVSCGIYQRCAHAQQVIGMCGGLVDRLR